MSDPAHALGDPGPSTMEQRESREKSARSHSRPRSRSRPSPRPGSAPRSGPSASPLHAPPAATTSRASASGSLPDALSEHGSHAGATDVDDDGHSDINSEDEYERIRQRNILMNDNLLATLGVKAAASIFASQTSEPATPRKRRPPPRPRTLHDRNGYILSLPEEGKTHVLACIEMPSDRRVQKLIDEGAYADCTALAAGEERRWRFGSGTGALAEGEEPVVDGVSHEFRWKTWEEVNEVQVLETTPESDDSDVSEPLANLALVKEKRPKVPYSELTGATCHQCKRKSDKPKMRCRDPHCEREYCVTCCARYDFEFDEENRSWICPWSTGTCNCGACRAKRGQEPLGISSFGRTAARIEADRQGLALSQYLAQLEGTAAPRKPTFDRIRLVDAATDIVAPELPQVWKDYLAEQEIKVKGKPRKRRKSAVDGEKGDGEKKTKGPKGKRKKKGEAGEAAGEGTPGEGAAEGTDGAKAKKPRKRKKKDTAPAPATGPTVLQKQVDSDGETVHGYSDEEVPPPSNRQLNRSTSTSTHASEESTYQHASTTAAQPSTNEYLARMQFAHTPPPFMQQARRTPPLPQSEDTADPMSDMDPPSLEPLPEQMNAGISPAGRNLTLAPRTHDDVIFAPSVNLPVPQPPVDDTLTPRAERTERASNTPLTPGNSTLSLARLGLLPDMPVFQPYLMSPEKERELQSLGQQGQGQQMGQMSGQQQQVSSQQHSQAYASHSFRVSPERQRQPSQAPASNGLLFDEGRYGYAPGAQSQQPQQSYSHPSSHSHTPALSTSGRYTPSYQNTSNLAPGHGNGNGTARSPTPSYLGVSPPLVPQPIPAQQMSVFDAPTRYTPPVGASPPPLMSVSPPLHYAQPQQSRGAYRREREPSASIPASASASTATPSVSSTVQERAYRSASERERTAERYRFEREWENGYEYERQGQSTQVQSAWVSQNENQSQQHHGQSLSQSQSNQQQAQPQGQAQAYPHSATYSSQAYSASQTSRSQSQSYTSAQTYSTSSSTQSYTAQTAQSYQQSTAPSYQSAQHAYTQPQPAAQSQSQSQQSQGYDRYASELAAQLAASPRRRRPPLPSSILRHKFPDTQPQPQAPAQQPQTQQPAQPQSQQQGYYYPYQSYQRWGPS